MPLVNRLSNDYNPSDAWSSGIRSIGTIMAQMPAIRAMASQRQAMAEFQRAHAGYETAATGEANARTGLIGQQTMGESLKNKLTQTAIDKQAALMDEMRTNPPVINPDGSITFPKGTGDVLADLMGLSTDPVKDAQTIKTISTIPKTVAPVGGKVNPPNPPNSADAAGVISGIGANLIKNFTNSGQVPLDDKGRPSIPISIAPNLSTDMSDKAAMLSADGMPLPEATSFGRRLVMGVNPTMKPNVVTNTPAIPGGVFSKAIPAVTSTNRFDVTPDTNSIAQIVSQLIKINPRGAAALGFDTNQVPAAVNADVQQRSPSPATPAVKPPPMDVQWLASNPSPARVATFEAKYGKGSSGAIFNPPPTQ